MCRSKGQGGRRCPSSNREIDAARKRAKRAQQRLQRLKAEGRDEYGDHLAASIAQRHYDLLREQAQQHRKQAKSDKKKEKTQKVPSSPEGRTAIGIQSMGNVQGAVIAGTGNEVRIDDDSTPVRVTGSDQTVQVSGGRMIVNGVDVTDQPATTTSDGTVTGGRVDGAQVVIGGRGNGIVIGNGGGPDHEVAANAKRLAKEAKRRAKEARKQAREAARQAEQDGTVIRDERGNRVVLGAGVTGIGTMAGSVATVVVGSEEEAERARRGDIPGIGRFNGSVGRVVVTGQGNDVHIGDGTVHQRRRGER